VGLQERLLGAIFPLQCQLCLQRVNTHPAICNACADDLPWLEHACEICAVSLPSGAGKRCGACQSKLPFLQKTTVLFEYLPPVDRLISDLKFKQQLGLARVFGEILAARLQARAVGDRPAVIVPVPLHRRRLAERGFNQSVELARPLARAWGISIINNVVSRTRATRAQSGLSAKARQTNVKGAFVVNPTSLPRSLPRHVLILDDVVTTGATVNELAGTLQKAGVQTIEVAAIARSS